MSYGGVASRSMKKRLKTLSEYIPVVLDLAGDIVDHLNTLDHKVFERIQTGSITKRIERLEEELDDLDDWADLQILEKDKPAFLVSYPIDESDGSDVEVGHKSSKVYNIFQYIYFFCASLLLLGPLSSVLWEMFLGLRFSLFSIFNHLQLNWNSLYMPLLAPMSWMLAGYFA